MLATAVSILPRDDSPAESIPGTSLHPWGDQSRMSEVSERDREEVPFRTRLFAAFSDARLRS